MRINKLYIVLGLVIAFALFFELAAHADQTNELTKITFNAPVQIPGKVLPAGTYLFEQADPNDDQDLVRILSVDRSVLYATLQTVPTDRQEPTGDTTITLAEPESGRAGDAREVVLPRQPDWSPVHVFQAAGASNRSG